MTNEEYVTIKLLDDRIKPLEKDMQETGKRLENIETFMYSVNVTNTGIQNTLVKLTDTINEYNEERIEQRVEQRLKFESYDEQLTKYDDELKKYDGVLSSKTSKSETVELLKIVIPALFTLILGILGVFYGVPTK